eukprot:4032410-Alexandrium_andersonii.AAC.1
MEAMSRAFEECRAEERERQGLQERAEEYARAEHAQLLRNELVEADRARAAIQREAFTEAEQRFAERERENERQSERRAEQYREEMLEMQSRVRELASLRSSRDSRRHSVAGSGEIQVPSSVGRSR